MSEQPQGDPSEHEFLFDVCQKCGISAFNLDDNEPCHVVKETSEQPQVEDSEFTRRGEWREWTPEYVSSLIGDRVSGLQSICDAHNAAMAANQLERCEVCNSELSQCGVQGIDGEPSLDCLVCKLRGQLAAERARSKGLEVGWNACCEDLAAEREKVGK